MFELTAIAGCEDADREGDVVFVHGASSGPEMPWHPPGRPEMSFPKMLGEDVPSIGTWSLRYQMSYRRKDAQSMTLERQGLNTLSEMASKGLGNRPIVFIAHSVGGIVVKHLLGHAAADDADPDWTAILRQIRGIVFLSTPHFGVRFPWIAKLLPFATQNKVVHEIAEGNVDLLRLNDKFQDIVRVHKVRVEVFYEQKPMFLRPRIDERTADPNLPGVAAIPLNFDHNEICQPSTRNGLPYSGVCVLVRQCCAPPEIRENSGDFDIFLSHNSKDKPTVRKLALALRRRNLKPWLDQWELVPGHPWQEELEKTIRNAKSAAILIGKDGLGPWEDREMRACLNEFTKRGLPVIPVLLPGAPERPELPSLFLQDFTWVDMREGMTRESLDQLQRGIPEGGKT